MKDILKWLWPYFRQYRFRYGIGLCFVIVVTVLSMVNPVILGRIVDEVIKLGHTGQLWAMLGIMLLSTFLRMIVRYSCQINFEICSQGTVQAVREDLYKRIQKLDFVFFDKTKTGDIMARLTGDIEAIRHFLAWVVYGSFENSIIFLTSLIAFFFINAGFTLILLTLLPVIAFIAWRLSQDVKPTFTAIRDQFSRLNSVVQENISGNRVVKAFTREKHEIGKFMQENLDFKKKNLESARVWERYIPVLDTFSGIFSLIIMLGGSLFVINNWMTLGELVTYSSFIWAINQPVRMAGWLINDAQRFIASGEKVARLGREEPAIFSPPDGYAPHIFRGKIEFRHVFFSYGDEPVLEDVSFTVEPGQFAAIIGPTGSGKTSLFRLMMRFYDVTQGAVLIDDVDVRAWNLDALRKYTGMAMQDVFLFSDSLEGNITYADPGVPQAQIQAAVEIANIDSFINELKEGYETIIGERGVGLSGGQQQRIALARLLVRNPGILLLDSTTSAVDIHTERHIQNALRSRVSGKTLLMITHRISSVMDADVIFVVENGKITERGRHPHLSAGTGWYGRTFIHQGGIFISGGKPVSETSECGPEAETFRKEA